MSFPFDHVKAKAAQQTSLIRQLQRTAAWRYIEMILPSLPGTEILELKKGTPEDTQLFQSAMVSLEATDLTEESLQQLLSPSAGMTMTTQVCSHIVDPNHLDETYFNKQFDLIVADFDELNGLSPTAIQNFFNTLPSLLTPRGRFIGVFKTRFCLWSMLWRTCTFRFKKLFMRIQAEEKIQSGSEWKYQPSKIVKLCRKGFKIKSVSPIGLFMPPLELNYLFENKPHWIIKLRSLEKRFQSYRYMARYSDYFLIDVQVK